MWGENMNKYVAELFETVIKNDYCIGCGVCACYPGSPLKMKINESGKYVPVLLQGDIESFKIDILAICPFSNKSRDENMIGSSLFKDVVGIKHSVYTGYYLKNYAGYAIGNAYRERGSSGGMGTWLPTQLLKQNLVDAIIHVKATTHSEGDKLFSYQISKNSDELALGAKSKYYPIEMSEIIKYVRTHPARYALIGIPCFIKAIRLLAQSDEQIKNNIKYTIGLVCGHLKTDVFAKSLAWQMGIKPSELTAIDFRIKIQGLKASNYGVQARGVINGNEVEKSSPTNCLYATDWGQGLFKYNACDYCDDVLAETADISIGDAWLPKYIKDSEGTNIIVVRNAELMKLISQSKEELFLEEISVDQVFESQSGGFRHRREGTAYRLFLKDKAGEWRPKKRTEPKKKIKLKRKKIYRKRVKLNEESFRAYEEALQKDNFSIFIEHMDPYIKDYNKALEKSVFEKGLSKIKNIILK